MAKKFPIFPKHPERICWGCDKYCRAEDLQCGNGCERILGLKAAPAPAPEAPAKPAKPHIKLPMKQH